MRLFTKYKRIYENMNETYKYTELDFYTARLPHGCLFLCLMTFLLFGGILCYGYMVLARVMHYTNDAQNTNHTDDPQNPDKRKIHLQFVQQ